MRSWCTPTFRATVRSLLRLDHSLKSCERGIVLAPSPLEGDQTTTDILNALVDASPATCLGDCVRRARHIVCDEAQCAKSLKHLDIRAEFVPCEETAWRSSIEFVEVAELRGR